MRNLRFVRPILATALRGSTVFILPFHRVERPNAIIGATHFARLAVAANYLRRATCVVR